MTDVVLVHGGIHGSWCWERLVPVLAASPQVRRVVAVDLPGRNAATSPVPLDDIGLGEFADHLVDVANAEDLHDVVAVGHSLGGVTLTNAAARLTDRLRRLVYLSAVSPPAGTSVMDLMAHPDSPLSRGADIVDTFCTGFSPRDRAWLTARLGTDPMRVLTDPMPVDRPPPSVLLTYIALDRDEALPPSLQQQQIEHLGIDDVVHIDSGHSPFVTHVDELAAVLLARA